ncbi:unnamed protein product [Ranitomeya imitator]|uniref:Uncharacterized protein n=1 Tax=Ranitomeya imitator TaxID=111125 RepID=A0ABN9LC90_9NEOB|nr:unnamed protein product [Ranitomeya imitator]
MDAASSEDSGTMENPSDSESTESEYHEASEGLNAAQAELQVPIHTSGQPKDTEKHQAPEIPAGSSAPTSPVPRVELSNVLISGCVALQKYLDDPAVLTEEETVRVCYETCRTGRRVLLGLVVLHQPQVADHTLTRPMCSGSST